MDPDGGELTLTAPTSHQNPISGNTTLDHPTQVWENPAPIREEPTLILNSREDPKINTKACALLKS